MATPDRETGIRGIGCHGAPARPGILQTILARANGGPPHEKKPATEGRAFSAHRETGAYIIPSARGRNNEMSGT